MNGATSWYDLIILGLAIIGVIVNVTSFVVLVRGRKNSMFFKLLKVIKVNFLLQSIIIQRKLFKVQTVSCMSTTQTCNQNYIHTHIYYLLISSFRGGGMTFFPVEHEKFPLSYIQDAKNFSVVKPLNSGEAVASLASPVPPPLSSLLKYKQFHVY